MSHADDLVAFLNASVTPWHAVAEVERRLGAAGFVALDERSGFSVKPGDKVWITRGGSTLGAFIIGRDWAHGFSLIGAHTDSPNLRLKPKPLYKKSGHHQLGVEVYGGVLYHTWLDRDLMVAGRVVDAQLKTELVKTGAVARIPSLAIHLNRQVNQDGLVLNAQSHLPPICGLDTKELTLASLLKRPEPMGFDLALVDAAPACRIGADQDYIVSGRLDNLASCHAAIQALLACQGTTQHTRGVLLFDHEECGSQSRLGADGPFLRDVLTRFVGDAATLAQGIARSFFVSADMAHAVHPNYADKHESAHAPIMGKGPVIKSNVNQRYATDGVSATRFAKAAQSVSVGVQNFVTRTDLACGTTIGPIAASLLGMEVVDVGNPMISMHSAREMCGATDVEPMIKVMHACLEGV